MDRHDEVPDSIRAVRDGRCKCMCKYQPAHAFFRPLAFRDNLIAIKEIIRKELGSPLSLAGSLCILAAFADTGKDEKLGGIRASGPAR